MSEQSQRQPTPEEMEKMMAVSQKGAEAAERPAESQEQRKSNVKEAMKEERDRQDLAQMSDEDIDRIADAFVGKAIAAFEERGAFDPPPERVQPASPPPAPPAPGQEAEAAAAAAEAAPAPQKQSWAQRFMGG
jgi:hypothetical protein